jgi:mono/diheme cytochrome c family protein
MASKHSTWQKQTVKRSILLALVVSSACDRGGATAQGVDGAQLYRDMCATCHGPKGKPPESMIARLNVRDLTSQELRSRVTPELVEVQVRKGSKNKLMPSFEGALSEEQIKAVSAYVSSPGFLQQ